MPHPQLLNIPLGQFMWGYQRHFRLGARMRIEQALAKIGLQAEVTVVLVGFARDSALAHQICIEPEDGPLSVPHLNGIRDRTDEIYRSDPEYHLLISNQRSDELHKRDLFLKSRSSAIEQAISGSGVFDWLTFFVSRSAPIDGYDVHTCVGVPTELLKPLPSFEDSVFDQVYGDIVKCCGWRRAHPDGLSGGFDVSVLKFNALEDEFNEFVTV